MKWFAPIALVIFITMFIMLLSCDGNPRAKDNFASIVLISVLSIFFYAFYIEKNRGQPITLKDLEKKVQYMKIGEGFYEDGSLRIIFLQKSDSQPQQVLVVILPIEIKLPTTMSALYITDRRDYLGNKIKGQGVIIPCPTFDIIKEIPFSWKEAKKTKQKNKGC